jgi:phosphoribosylformylglycinamidine cyclo-ligase
VTPSSYRSSGVDIEAGDRAVELMRGHVSSTHRAEVLGGIGGFAGAFSARFTGIEDPVLLSAADGVGTKLLIAQTLDRHDTVGIDLVAMVVDDLVCHGAEPLFLLDYIACGKLVPERIERIVSGIAKGSREARCALLGGETAEHPGVMEPDLYDLAAFGVGVADRGAMWGPERVREGDVVIGLASSGLHSNGFSLVRRIILEHDLPLDVGIPELGGYTLGEELLTPTRIYAPAMRREPCSRSSRGSRGDDRPCRLAGARDLPIPGGNGTDSRRRDAESLQSRRRHVDGSNREGRRNRREIAWGARHRGLSHRFDP